MPLRPSGWETNDFEASTAMNAYPTGWAYTCI